MKKLKISIKKYVLILTLITGLNSCFDYKDKRNLEGTWYYIETYKDYDPQKKVNIHYFEYWEVCFEDDHVFPFNRSGFFPVNWYSIKNDSFSLYTNWSSGPYVKSKIISWDSDKFTLARARDTVTYIKIEKIDKELKDIHYFDSIQKQWKLNGSDYYTTDFLKRESDHLKKHRKQNY